MNKQKKPLGQRIKAMFGGRFRAGSYSVAAAAVVIAIAIFLNLIVGSLPLLLLIESATEIRPINSSSLATYMTLCPNWEY